MDLHKREALVRTKLLGTWCCMSRPSPVNVRPYQTAATGEPCKHQSKAQMQELEKKNHKSKGSEQKEKKHPEGRTPNTRSEKLKKLGPDGNRGVRKDVLKTGEVGALIKQGFISRTNLDIKKPPDMLSSSNDQHTNRGVIATAVVSESPPPKYSNFASFVSDGLNAMNDIVTSTFDNKKAASTLYDMISQYDDREGMIQGRSLPKSNVQRHSKPPLDSSLGTGTFRFNDPSSCDVKLTLKSREGTTSSSLAVFVHSQILATQSKFFATKFNDSGLNNENGEVPRLIEISDCDNVEMYVETLRMMYSNDMKKSLVKETVSRVLGILKVCTSIVFQVGVASCLEYLEAVPWGEDDEENVPSLLNELQHSEKIGAREVLQRLSTEDLTGSKDVLISLLHLVTKATDEKARREMKTLVSKMLRENTAQRLSSGATSVDDLSKESIYESCRACTNTLLEIFNQASNPEVSGKMGGDRGLLIAQITRQADNLNWLLEIMIDRQIADDFVRIWAFQTDLAMSHRQVPIVFGRYEVSRVTASLCVALGKGHVLAPKEVRFMLLHNWLQPLFDDFGWMQRACKGLDRKVVEDGISQTILTLPLKQQQMMMLSWFDRFLKNGDDCPNLQRAFETWWRRTFIRTSMEGMFLPLETPPVITKD